MRFLTFKLPNPVAHASSVVLDFLLLIVRSTDDGPVAVAIPTSEKLIGVWVIDISSRATLFPDFNVVVEAVPNDFVLSKSRTGHQVDHE